MKLVLICVAIFFGTTFGDLAQPADLDKLLREGKYKEFSELTKVPESLAEPAEGGLKESLQYAAEVFGDLMLQPEQLQSTDEDERLHSNGHLNLWDNGEIPYAILKTNYTKDDIKTIKANIKSFNHLMGPKGKTFLTWRPQKLDDNNYVAIFRGAGCFAHVGQLGGIQAISLRPGMPYQPCLSKGWSHHEMTHTAGLMHQTARLDRELYTPMNKDNLPESFRRFYTDVVPIISSVGNSSFSEIVGPYEYLSLMQLPAYLPGFGGPFYEAPHFEGDIAEIGDTAKQELTQQDIQTLKYLYTGKGMGGSG